MQRDPYSNPLCPVGLHMIATCACAHLLMRKPNCNHWDLFCNPMKASLEASPTEFNEASSHLSVYRTAVLFCGNVENLNMFLNSTTTKDA